jgi:hypothetical protein
MSLRTLTCLVLLGSFGCGSDDAEPAKPALVCLSDAKLSGGISVDESLEHACGHSYATTALHVTVELRLPVPEGGYLGVRMFGLRGSTASGAVLGAGLELQPGVPPTERWAAGLDSGDACTATIEQQAPQPGLDLVVVTASVACSQPLVSDTPGVTPITVERLRVRAIYAP